MPNSKNQIVTVREVAETLQRSIGTIEELLREGAVPFGTAYKRPHGGYIYIIPRLAFERYMAGDFRTNVCPHCGKQLDI